MDRRRTDRVADDDGEIDHLGVEELSSSDTSDNDEDQDTSTIFISRNKKENWSAIPHTNNMAELFLVT